MARAAWPGRKGAGMLRTDNASWTFFRQRIVYLPASGTDNASWRLVSVPTACRETRRSFVSRCHHSRVALQRQRLRRDALKFRPIEQSDRPTPRESGDGHDTGLCRTKHAQPTGAPPKVAVLHALRVHDALSAHGTFLVHDALSVRTIRIESV